MDMGLFLCFVSLFDLVGHSAFSRNPPSQSREGALGLKGSTSGMTPLERVLMSLSGSLTASGGGGNGQMEINFVHSTALMLAPSHPDETPKLLFAAGSNIPFRINLMFVLSSYRVHT